MSVHEMNQDLIEAFERIGVPIVKDDIQTILRIGADKYLNNVNHSPGEESMSGIYIILSELKQLSL